LAICLANALTHPDLTTQVAAEDLGCGVEAFGQLPLEEQVRFVGNIVVAAAGPKVVGAGIGRVSAIRRAAGAAEAGPNLLRPSSLANEVAHATGGVVRTNKGGFTLEVPHGRRGITIRVAPTHIGISESWLDDIVSIVARIQGSP
jgi:hypothetical protein